MRNRTSSQSKLLDQICTHQVAATPAINYGEHRAILDFEKHMEQILALELLLIPMFRLELSTRCTRRLGRSAVAAKESIASPSSSFESAKMLAARTKSSSTSLALTYPLPSGAAMKARVLGQSYMTCPIPLQQWHMMFADLLKESFSKVVCFLCCWVYTVDTLLTSEAGAGAGDVAGGLATGALGFSTSERF